MKVNLLDQQFQSKTLKNTLEPQWDVSFNLNVPHIDEKYLKFEVYDEDFGKDSFEGSYSLSLERAINESVDGDWFDLDGKDAKLHG